MRHPARASAGNNDTTDNAAMKNNGFMIGSLAGGEYGGRPALGQAEIIWQSTAFGIDLTQMTGLM